MKWDILKALVFEADLKKAKTPEEIAKKHGISLQAVNDELAKGIKVEMEHTLDKATARTIALHHLDEFKDYYTRLKKMENDAEKK